MQARSPECFGEDEDPASAGNGEHGGAISAG